MDGVVHIDLVALPLLVDPLAGWRCHQRADAPDGRHQPVEHVAPMRHHIEREPAALRALVVPARALACLRSCRRRSMSRHRSDREDAAEEARFFTNISLAKPGRKSLSWMTPCLTPALSARRASSIASSTVGAVGFSIWMCLPAAIAWRTRAGPPAGRGAVHEDLVGAGESASSVVVAQPAMRRGERLEPVGIAPDDQQIGQQAVAVPQREATLARISQRFADAASCRCGRSRH